MLQKNPSTESPGALLYEHKGAPKKKMLAKYP